MTTPSAHEQEEEKTHIPWRTWVIVAIVIYSIIFIVLNSKSLKIHFVFFSVKTPVLVALLLAAALGFVAGLLTWRQREKRERKTQP